MTRPCPSPPRDGAGSDSDQCILTMALHDGLVSPAVAKEVYRLARREGRPALGILRERGIISPHTAARYIRETRPGPAPTLIAGYRLVSRLGEGAMGTVHRAVHVQSGREVALKVLSSPGEPSRVQRFRREIRAICRVDHPHVVKCFDAGEVGDTLYMALELVTGGDAGRVAKAAGGHLEEERALDIVLGAARGLTAIHAAGLIHRDIKPGNILLTADGEAKLADLGLSRCIAEEETVTSPGTVVGSPTSMAPEQLRGAKDLDIRADIYALGVTLHTLITGTPPFTGAALKDVVNAILLQPFPDPRRAPHPASAAVAAVILKACAKDRADRHQTPEELIADLLAVRGGDATRPRQASIRTAAIPRRPMDPLHRRVARLVGRVFGPPRR